MELLSFLSDWKVNGTFTQQSHRQLLAGRGNYSFFTAFIFRLFPSEWDFFFKQKEANYIIDSSNQGDCSP